MITTDISDRTTVGAGAIAEYEAFADLLESLSDEDWRTASRCEGFDVRDVAGHVVGLAEDTAAGVPGSRTAAEEAATVRDDGPAGAARRLRAAIGSVRGLLMARRRRGVGRTQRRSGPHARSRRADALVRHVRSRRRHPRRARPPFERGPGLDASIAYLDDAEAGELRRTSRPLTGRRSDDDPLQFVLVATGRADAAALGLDDSVNIYRRLIGTETPEISGCERRHRLRRAARSAARRSVAAVSVLVVRPEERHRARRPEGSPPAPMVGSVFGIVSGSTVEPLAPYWNASPVHWHLGGRAVVDVVRLDVALDAGDVAHEAFV